MQFLYNLDTAIFLVTTLEMILTGFKRNPLFSYGTIKSSLCCLFSVGQYNILILLSLRYSPKDSMNSRSAFNFTSTEHSVSHSNIAASMLHQTSRWVRAILL